jgi:hypothetical protein
MLSLWCSSRVSRVSCRRRIWVHEQHEFDIPACYEAVDVIVLEAVNVLEISVFRVELVEM